MNEKDLKQYIKTQAQRDVPDLKQEILAKARQNQAKPGFFEQFKRKPLQLVSAFSLVFITAFLVISFIGQTEDSPSYSTLYLDINPAFQIDFDEDETIINVITLSNEADIIYSRLPDFKTTALDDYLDLIVDASIDLGYLTEENPYIMIDIIDQNQDRHEAMLTALESRIPEHAHARIPNIEIVRGNAHTPDQSDDHPSDLPPMTPQRLRIIEAIALESDYTFEDLENMNMSELMRIAREYGVELHPGGRPN